MSIEERLAAIGLNAKEAAVFAYLTKYGRSGASEIASRLGLPKSSANFLADALWKRGIVMKTRQRNADFYEADLARLEDAVERDIGEKRRFLDETLGELRSLSCGQSSKPRISTVDGADGCRNAYSKLARSGAELFEFWAHGDLVRAFGEPFMRQFIADRVKKGVFCHALSSPGPWEDELLAHAEAELRNLSIIPESFGPIRSSIAVSGDRILVVHASEAVHGVEIVSAELSETLRTVFRAAAAGVAAPPSNP